MSQTKIIGQMPVGPGPGAELTVICQATSAIQQDIGPKIDT